MEHPRILTAALLRVLQSQVYMFTGAELKAWRSTQPGIHIAGKQKRKGWTQVQAAEWMGVTPRCWQNWEAESPIAGASRIRRIVEYTQSFDQKLDHVLHTKEIENL